MGEVKKSWKRRLVAAHPIATAIAEMGAITVLLPFSIILYGAKEAPAEWWDYEKELWDVVRNKGHARHYWQ